MTQPPRAPAGAAAPRDLMAAARRFGTPVSVTAVGALDAAAAELAEAFPDPWLRAFSVKANDVPRVVAHLAGRGLDANVVSAGEWAVARTAGLPNERVTLEGIGKTDADLRLAVRAAAEGAPLRWVSVESPEELDALSALARAAGLGAGRRAGGGAAGGPQLQVLLRLNPDVTPETHAGLAVGRAASKFGMTETELTAAAAALAPDGGPLLLRGIHVHVGSQLGAVDAWRDAIRRGLALLALVGAGRESFDTLDVGGGFPVGEPGTVPSPGRFARELPALLEAIPPGRRPARLAVEPGRFLVAAAGTLVATVLHVRDRGEAGRVVVLDTGMTELVRPALYDAWHRIEALTSLGRPVDVEGVGPAEADGRGLARVDGPVCESTDTLGSHSLPPLRRGDLVAIAGTGAYGASMAMTYNGRPRVPEVLLTADHALVLARRRGVGMPAAARVRR